MYVINVIITSTCLVVPSALALCFPNFTQKDPNIKPKKLGTLILMNLNIAIAYLWHATYPNHKYYKS